MIRWREKDNEDNEKYHHHQQPWSPSQSLLMLSSLSSLLGNLVYNHPHICKSNTADPIITATVCISVWPMLSASEMKVIPLWSDPNILYPSPIFVEKDSDDHVHIDVCLEVGGLVLVRRISSDSTAAGVEISSDMA